MLLLDAIQFLWTKKIDELDLLRTLDQESQRLPVSPNENERKTDPERMRTRD